MDNNHIEIDFDGDDFCPTPMEQNAVVIWESLCSKYDKFHFADPSLKSSNKYLFGFSSDAKGKIQIGAISIDVEIGITLHEIPLADVGMDLSVGTWYWDLADPKSLDKFFEVMDCIYSGFHQYREGQSLQIGYKAEDDMLDREQTTKKLYMKAAETLDVPYTRQFIVELQLELNNPEFGQASGPDDWRTYIITDVRDNWHFIDELGRLLFWFSAKERQKRETYA